jgi:hypothetical protein
MQALSGAALGISELWAFALAAQKANDFESVAGLLDKLSRPITRESLALADTIAFALGHLRRTFEAASLLEECYTLEPTHRRASGMAYLFYDASLALNAPRAVCPKEYNREALRKQFRKWIGEALRLEPKSVRGFQSNSCS